MKLEYAAIYDTRTGDALDAACRIHRNIGMAKALQALSDKLTQAYAEQKPKHPRDVDAETNYAFEALACAADYLATQAELFRHDRAELAEAPRYWNPS